MFVVPAQAGTTDSAASNFKESFNITTGLLHNIPVDRIFLQRRPSLNAAWLLHNTA